MLLLKNPNRFMKYIVLFVFSSLICSRALSQCNTTLNKLLPPPTINNDDRFGSDIAANDQYLVVTAENSDTLGILYAGAAFVYEKTAAGWAYRAMLFASDPDEYDFFGNDVSIDATGNTIVIINRRYSKGVVYIFQKPAGGWQTTTETYHITMPEYLEFDANVDISDDGKTIAVTSWQESNNQLYIFRQPVGGWTNTVSPQIIGGFNFPGQDVLIHDNYIFLSSRFDPVMPGIYVFKTNGGNYFYQAKLSITNADTDYFGQFLTVQDDMIAAPGMVLSGANPGNTIFIFRKTNGEWSDATHFAQIQISGGVPYRFPIQFLSSTQLAAATAVVQPNGYLQGKVLQFTASDDTWQDVSSSDVYTQDDIPQPLEFIDNLIWNGQDLIHATDVSLNGTSRFNVVSMTKSGGLWGSEQHVVLDRRSAANTYFGSSVLKSGDELLCGAPYDNTAGLDAGALLIFRKDADLFKPVGAIRPTPRKRRPSGTSDAGFGYSSYVYKDQLAVGAPFFSNDANRTGKIFFYKRITSSWTSAELYDSLSPPANLTLDNFGSAVVMNDNYLFAAAFNSAPEHNNVVLVYTKVNNRWQFLQALSAARPVANKGMSAIEFSLNNDELAVGAYLAIGGGVNVLKLNNQTGLWDWIMPWGDQGLAISGSAVKLFDNQLFVGAPSFDYKNVYRSGAVLVYTRYPGEAWHLERGPSAILGANTPIEGGYFGSSLDAVGNTLAVGAPGMFLTFDSNVRTIPGNTYIIQAEDFYWQHTHEVLVFQGDRHAFNERDYFGSAVGIDTEYFYIGAQNENTSVGSFSGAVYYVPTPPLIFLQAPVCANADPIQLTGYPFGGTWSGPGVDPSGKFDPKLVPAGVTTLHYKTVNCSHDGVVQIEVTNPFDVAQLSPADVSICSESQTELDVTAIDDATYTWYYKPEGAATYTAIGGGHSSFIATNTGDYKVDVILSACRVSSAVFTVSVADFPVRVGPQSVVCASSDTVSLVASPGGGTWGGPGVEDNKFYAKDLSNGYHALTYTITSPGGCTVTLRDSINIQAVPMPNVYQLHNDYCATGSAELVCNLDGPSFSYEWYFNATSPMDLTVINKSLRDTAIVYDQGYYAVLVSNGICSNGSNPVAVGFLDDLLYTLNPQPPANLQLCEKDEFTLTVSARDDTQYTWSFKPAGNEPADFTDIPGGTTPSLVIRESGAYEVKGVYGFCSFVSDPIVITFLRDSVFVPNVFTPNGDAKNPVFKVESLYPISELTVYNRYGQQVYASPDGTWDGGDASSGVYFWRILYRGCNHRERERKGWVQLIR